MSRKPRGPSDGGPPYELSRGPITHKVYMSTAATDDSMARYELFVCYSQIAVFNGLLRKPFNNWTKECVDQGFSWRPGSVSFRTLVDGENLSVHVRTATRMPEAEGVRAISVPFTCVREGHVEVATITESAITDIPPGVYQLVYETGTEHEACWCRFTFVENGELEPGILIADESLVIPSVFAMDAEPA